MKDPWKYVKDVVSGKIVSCRYIKLLCKKLLNEYEVRQYDEEYPWVYNEKRAQHFVNFTEMCKYPDGMVGGQHVSLHPWQLFLFSMAYGWRSKADVNVPRFTDIYARIARKQDKTTGVSTIMVYELLTGPPNHEQYITAVDRNQASIAFRKAVAIATSLPTQYSQLLKKSYGELRNISTGSTVVARSKQNKASDGASCFRGFWDEAGRIEDEESFDILHSSQGAWKGRHQNFYISTAQANRETRYYSDCEDGRRILEGVYVPPDDMDRTIVAIYELDEGDKWDDEDVWVKSNPSLGLSIDSEFLRGECHKAKVSPAKKSEFLRKYCNIYTGSDSPWLDVEQWNKLKVNSIKREGPCYLALDLGKTSDINAACLLWVSPDGKYETDFHTFLPRGAVDKAPKHTVNIYKRAISSGILELTPGDTIDHRAIKDYIQSMCSKYDIREIIYDPYKSQQLITELTLEGLPMVQQRQGRVSLGPGIAETERIIVSNQLAHLGDPFIAWQLANCQVNTDKHDLIELTKPKDYARKIDSIIALTMCVSRATVHGGLNQSEPSVFII